MDAIECIKTRRSIRAFKPEPVPRKTLNEILDCGRHAPSAMGRQPWTFVVVTDLAKKQELAQLKGRWGDPLLAAPLLIGVCADLSKSRNYWIEDAANAAENILLAAHALGLDGCWVTMRFDDTALNAKIQRALGLGDSVFPVCLLAIGYAAEKPGERKLRSLDEIVR